MQLWKTTTIAGVWATQIKLDWEQKWNINYMNLIKMRDDDDDDDEGDLCVVKNNDYVFNRQLCINCK